MDCIHYKVREDGRILSRAAYVIMGVTIDGYKDILSITVGANETLALAELEIIKEKWGKKYPYAISNLENNWEDVNSFFQFSSEIRRIMYTTNVIEGLNRQYRKVTKNKSVFLTDNTIIRNSI